MFFPVSEWDQGFDGLTEQFLAAPSKQRFGAPVEVADVPLEIGHEKRIRPEGEEILEHSPGVVMFLFAFAAVQSDFNIRGQFGFAEGFDQKSVGLELAGSPQEFGIGVGGEEDDARVDPVPESDGQVDAVHLSREADVQEQNVRVGLFDFREGGLALCCGAANLVARLLQPVRDLHGDGGFVLDDEDSSFGRGGFVGCGRHAFGHDDLFHHRRPSLDHHV